MIYWATVGIYLAIIFVMSSIPGYELPKLDFNFSDKIAHFLEFGILGIFLYNAFKHTSPVKKPFLWSIVIGFLWGVSDELHQFFVPGRQCSFRDFFADASGVLIFVLISKMLNEHSVKKTHLPEQHLR